MKVFVKEFKEFIMRGNVIDMAVGVIIGGAFNNIVSSLVNDIVMPVITLITGKINFTDMLIALDGNSYPSLKAAQDAAAPVIAYGNFIQIVVQFLLTAFAHLPCDQRHQQAAQTGSGAGSDHQDLPVLQVRDPHRRSKMSALCI